MKGGFMRKAHNDDLGPEWCSKEKHERFIDATFGEKVTMRRKILSINQRDLAKLVMVSVNTIQSYEQGHLPRGNHFVNLARTLRCSMDWLSGLTDVDDGPGGLDESRDFKMSRRLISPPLLGDQGSDRHPDSIGYTYEYEWLAHISSEPSNVRCLIIHGTTMAPTLLNGDIVLLDAGRRTIQQGNIYALSYGTAVLVNRLEIRPGGILRVVSDNQTVAPPYEIEREAAEIIGRIIWLSRRLQN